MNLVSADRKSKRAELLDLLLEHGILRRSETQPVLSRDGSSARWMLDSLPVTLTPRGAELAGRLLLERLQGFDGHQLATFGLTAVPVLQSAILQSDSRYHGLLVRREHKAHGSQKLIEGSIDSDEPVIMIEDSIASGTSVSQGIATLEAAGLRVEGCVALVRFGWEGGCSDLQERGYHVETIYDIFEDFMTRMEGEQGPIYNPTKVFADLRWSQLCAPEGLHPAYLARAALNEYLSSGELLRAPVHLDRDDYDSSGGAWVSLRSRNDIFDRHARDGFWHFPGEPSWGVGEDIVRAAFLTACNLPKNADRRSIVESSHIAVTFFSALERVTVAELDNDRHGIVVVSGERRRSWAGPCPACLVFATNGNNSVTLATTTPGCTDSSRTSSTGMRSRNSSSRARHGSPVASQALTTLPISALSLRGPAIWLLAASHRNLWRFLRSQRPPSRYLSPSISMVQYAVVWVPRSAT